MVLLSATSIDKTFQQNGVRVQVLKGLTFSADAGEVLVLRGANGCGKTTLLNLLAGLENPTAGTIQRVPPFAAGAVGYVFQNYNSSLLPWLTLGENMTLPLRLQRLSRGEQHARLAALNEVYDLQGVPVDRYPTQASGGQKQRACIARAVLCPSPVVLMDEPFSSLDENGHKDLAHLVDIVRNRENRLVIMVLHDLDDAILMADRLVILGGHASSSIRADIRVDLPRPRLYEHKVAGEFTRLRTLILEERHAEPQG